MGTETNGEEIARRFELLLDRFRKPDGERWRNFEMGRSSGGRLSSSYVSALRKGRFDRPGLEQLSLIANVMDFPLELWWTEPERWDEVLRQSRTPGPNSHTTAAAEARPDEADLAVLLPYRRLGEEHRKVVVALAERLAALHDGEDITAMPRPDAEILPRRAPNGLDQNQP